MAELLPCLGEYAGKGEPASTDPACFLAERTFSGRQRPVGPRVYLNGCSQRSCGSLKAAFDNVVIVLAIEAFHVEADPRI